MGYRPNRAARSGGAVSLHLTGMGTLALRCDFECASEIQRGLRAEPTARDVIAIEEHAERSGWQIAADGRGRLGHQCPACARNGFTP